MVYWIWDPALSVGIEVIDSQHKRIIDYINDLHDACRERDKKKVEKVLLGLVDYTLTHFAFEEELMARAGYPLSEPHKRVHEAFTTHMKNYLERHRRGENIVRELISELEVWLTNHIKNDDHDYAPYVQKELKKQERWINNTIGRLFSRFA